MSQRGGAERCRHFTCRALVSAAPAAVVAATLPALAAGVHSDAALLALREPYERAVAVVNEIGAARRRAGREIAEARWNAAVDANAAVVEQITETPACTLEGIIFKARVADNDSGNFDLAALIVTDLVAFGGRDA